MNQFLSYLALAMAFFMINMSSLVTADPTGEPEAVRECGNIHDIDMHKFPNTHAEFINDECALNCTVDGRAMNTVSINEGYVCPRNIRGHCRRGKCNAPVAPNHHGDAVTQCGNLNHIDTHLFNNSGTHYAEAECKVFCFINGQEASEHNINEGYQCPANANGTCRNGACVVTSTVPPRPTTMPTPKVTPQSTTTTQKATTAPTAKPTTKQPTPKPTTKQPTPTTPRVDTFENVEVERVSSRFIGGQMLDGTKVTNISVCYKTVPIRLFDRAVCKYYCSSTDISCIIQSPDRQFGPEAEFLFNVWQKGVSIGDAFQSIKELFTVVKDEPGSMIAHNGKDNYNMNAITTLYLYNVEKLVGNLSVELDLTYRRKP